MKCKYCGETNLKTNTINRNYVVYTCSNCKDTWVVNIMKGKKIRTEEEKKRFKDDIKSSP